MSWPTSSGAASQFSDAEVAALQLAVANGIATYATGEIERVAGVLPVAGSGLLPSDVAYGRGFVLGQLGGIEFTAAAATFTSVAAADNGSGKVRLSSAGVHGLTAASNDRYIYVSAAAGLTAGLYRMTYVDADSLDLADIPYASITTPAVGLVNVLQTVFSATVPAGAMGPNGVVDVELCLEASNNATAKSTRVLFGGTQAATDASFNSITVAQQRVRICNQPLYGALASAQRCNSMLVNSAAFVAANTTTLAKDTSSAVTVSVQALVTTPDEWIRLQNVQAVLYPAL